MLICWDFSYHNENGDPVETKTSRQLQEEVFYHVPMHYKIELNDNEYIKDLFVPERTYDKMPVVFNFKPENSAAEDEEEFSSTIFSLNPNGFGFIKNEEKNNIFFHYSRVTNRDWAELKSGMRVKYIVEEDEERSKRDNAPRYRATRVRVID
jgi:cold shock CspA family protein